MVHRAERFDWKPAYDTGIAGMDEQHREVVSAVSAIHRALQENADRSRLLLLVDDLIRHLTGHFRGEEEMMRAAGYPKLPTHRLEHTILRTRIVNLHRASATQRRANADRIVALLEGWLDSHIQGADRELADYLQSHP